MLDKKTGNNYAVIVFGDLNNIGDVIRGVEAREKRGGRGYSRLFSMTPIC